MTIIRIRRQLIGTVLVLTAFSALASPLDWFGKSVEGSGKIVKQERSAKDFRGVVIAVSAKVDRGPTHAEQGRARRAALVEHEHFRARKPAPLQGEEGEQHRLASAGRTHHPGVADIADMKIEPDRR